ncbi:MAG: hypothetical protein JW716_04730 [Candidatus Aenigmarchaeota archaeon]|nr:hypothetical protein [Candidatus Aenigmarchaeota archaeon]
MGILKIIPRRKEITGYGIWSGKSRCNVHYRDGGVDLVQNYPGGDQLKMVIKPDNASGFIERRDPSLNGHSSSGISFYINLGEKQRPGRKVAFTSDSYNPETETLTGEVHKKAARMFTEATGTFKAVGGVPMIGLYNKDHPLNRIFEELENLQFGDVAGLN